MIGATVAPDRGFAARLAAHANRLARAALENRRLADRVDPLRWRKASLLWPLFTRD